MDIAIIGTGISGLVVAHGLHDRHRLVLYEAADYVGGHTHTVEVPSGQGMVAVDTGFIVFNEKTYPNFCQLLAQLKVAHKPSTMSFSVHDERTGLEYNGQDLNHLFAQRRNLVRPAFWGLLLDIMRFNRAAKAFLGQKQQAETLGEFLERGKYGKAFVEQYILPMGGAIWSAGRQTMLDFPMHFFAAFFENHGMLSVSDRPVWRVVEGGSQTYVRALIRPFADKIRTQCPVVAIQRDAQGVWVTAAGQAPERYDRVVLALHADQALRLLMDPSECEGEVLGALGYESNEAILHTDTALLPNLRKVWAAWNCRLGRQPEAKVGITYNMNILQGLTAPKTYCVSLNQTAAIDPSKIIARMDYAHPVFNERALTAQKRFHEVDGRGGVHYCGAYWFNGFHEDGVRSGLRVVSAIDAAVARSR